MAQETTLPFDPDVQASIPPLRPEQALGDPHVRRLLTEALELLRFHSGDAARTDPAGSIGQAQAKVTAALELLEVLAGVDALARRVAKLEQRAGRPTSAFECDVCERVYWIDPTTMNETKGRGFSELVCGACSGSLTRADLA